MDMSSSGRVSEKRSALWGVLRQDKRGFSFGFRPVADPKTEIKTYSKKLEELIHLKYLDNFNFGAGSARTEELSRVFFMWIAEY